MTPSDTLKQMIREARIFTENTMLSNAVVVPADKLNIVLNENEAMEQRIRELQPVNADLYEALERCRNALKIYAQEDCIAGGNGLGCMSDPHSVVALPIEQADAALAKARGEQ